MPPKDILQVNPSEAWLRDDVDGSVYFPQPDGNFNLQEAEVSLYASLIVEGPSALQLPHTNLPTLSRSSSVAMSALSSTPAAGPSTNAQASNFRSVIASKRAPSFNLK